MKIIEKLRFILTRPEKNKLAMLLLGTLLLAVLETFSIGIIIPIMDLFINPEKIQASGVLLWFYQLTGAENNTTFLIILIAVATILFVAKSLYVVFMFYMQKRLINNIYSRLSTKLLGTYLNRTYTFHLDNNNALLFKNLTIEVTHFSVSFLFAFVVVCAETTVLLAIAGLLAYLAPIITLAIGGLLAIILAAMTVFLKKRIERYAEQRMQASEEIHKFGLEALQAVKEIKVYNAQEFFLARYSQAAKKQAESNVKFSTASVLPRHILETALWGSILIVLLISVYFRKSAAELIPIMSAFGLAALRFLPSVHKIYTQGNIMRYYSNSVDVVYQALQEAAPRASKLLEKPALKDRPIPQGAQSIFLKDIEFAFGRSKATLFNGLNVSIPSHKTVAFVGETGAGKSTLIDILMGLLTPDKGRFYYGSVPITTENISAYRQKTGYVPQTIFLSDSTLEENIAFGIPQDKIDYQQLMHVLRIVQLESFVQQLPLGVKTQVGQRGIRLSGGQRQRVGIARALYRNPEILIMDEATSALDGYTEKEVNKAIKNLYGRLTIIFIAHRLSTVEYADIIYVLQDGKIVDQGNFQELTKSSLAFQKIASQIAA